MALEEGGRGFTRLDLGVTGKQGQGDEFAVLTGRRLEAGLWQELRWTAVTLRLGYRFQREDIGEVASAPQPLPPNPECPDGCTAVDVQPYGYDSHLAWGWAQARPGRFSLELGVAREWRQGLEETRRVLSRPDGSTLVQGQGRGEDRRWFTSAGVTFRVTRNLALVARHEWLQRDASGSAGPLPWGGGGMMEPMPGPGEGGSVRKKQVFLLGTTVSW
ncbi:MAG: hypothetical protein QM767_14000 [Anaeromyxobacter sp.]